ncbi:ABC transmembrane type-1 domain-containing protein [Candidatus Hydrogenisulfobacillus filiaventi]|uniref:ABC transmembrane type-1 domain-containing protein n=1 Tax=Candidatus Hydrogenisulfobacillus filiaventi TaxID=2707344 RepID=A0A6F8ZGD0_9FIRM|nr:ABC transmembrane type-1 domain-containing protein [Candidatus Hydrogenisulfobacillus filiaventi]
MQTSLLLPPRGAGPALMPRPGVWTRFRRHPLARAGGAGLALLVAFTFLGPVVYPINPDQPHLAHLLQPPGGGFPLGTDGLGRDELARLMWGGQPALETGFAAAAVAVVAGTAYGMIAGLAGGVVDAVLMRLVDVVLAVPPLFLLLFLGAVLRPGVPLLILILGAVSWSPVSRLVRAEVLRLKQLPFVEAEYAMGAGPLHMMRQALLPNLLGVVLVTATFTTADAILAVAVLSFLGLGLPPPAPNWGRMLASAMGTMYQHTWWLVYPPGLAILATELSLTWVGDALRAAFDPRLTP